MEQRHWVACGVTAAAALAAAGGIGVWQLSKILFSVVKESDYEAGRLIASVTAFINSESPDQEVPEELELEDAVEGIYAYGSLQELYFRRSIGGETDWQWSFDKIDWTPTDNLAPNADFILDPPSVIFITRLHLMSVVRRKVAAAAAAAAVEAASGGGGDGSSSSSAAAAGAAGRHRCRIAPRIPPPVQLPQWAVQQLQEQQQQLGSQLLSSRQQQQQHSSSSSSSSDGQHQHAQRRIEDAPDLLCCPITGQIMLQPVTLPSGKTFEHDAVRKWITQHGTDPTTLTPASIHDLHPNLVVREMVERWLAGADPLADEEVEDH